MSSTDEARCRRGIRSFSPTRYKDSSAPGPKVLQYIPDMTRAAGAWIRGVETSFTAPHLAADRRQPTTHRPGPHTPTPNIHEEL